MHTLQATSREKLSIPVSSNPHFHKVRHKAPAVQSNSFWRTFLNQMQEKRLPSTLMVKMEGWALESLAVEKAGLRMKEIQETGSLDVGPPAGVPHHSNSCLSSCFSPVWIRSPYASCSEWDIFLQEPRVSLKQTHQRLRKLGKVYFFLSRRSIFIYFWALPCPLLTSPLSIWAETQVTCHLPQLARQLWQKSGDVPRAGNTSPLPRSAVDAYLTYTWLNMYVYSTLSCIVSDKNK